MRKKWMILMSLVAIFLLGLIFAGPIMSNVEQPAYDMVQSDGAIEIRQYAPRLVAYVIVPGAREEAIGDGFSLLADYIFGNNKAATKIAMTAPVQQAQPSAQNEQVKIAMTAPVQQTESLKGWRVQFVMPAEYTRETLPEPVNKQVQIEQIGSQRQAAIRFSGSGTNENVMKHEKMLRAYLAQSQREILSGPNYAFYNPPWTLPIMRRNEVMFEVK